MTTPADALTYLLGRVSSDPDLLTDLLTRLAVTTANQPGAVALFEHFECEFRLERGRLNLQRALSVAKVIRP